MHLIFAAAIIGTVIFVVCSGLANRRRLHDEEMEELRHLNRLLEIDRENESRRRRRIARRESEPRETDEP